MKDRLIDRRSVVKAAVFVPLTFLVGGCKLPDSAINSGTGCSPVHPTIEFRTQINESAKSQIDQDFQRMPAYVQNRINGDGYKVIVLKNEAAVGALYQNSAAGGMADYGKKEIVIGDPLDFPHELGHVVDYEFGDLSMSQRFLGPEILARRKELAQGSELRKRVQGQYDQETDQEAKKALGDALAEMNSSIVLFEKVAAMSSLPAEEFKAEMYKNEALQDYVRHLFTPGFEAYYSSNPNVRLQFQKENPEFYAAFTAFDSEMRSKC